MSFSNTPYNLLPPLYTLPILSLWQHAMNIHTLSLSFPFSPPPRSTFQTPLTVFLALFGSAGCNRRGAGEGDHMKQKRRRAKKKDLEPFLFEV